MKLRKAKGVGDVVHYFFWCPGCDSAHRFDVPRWSFNGDMESPTFAPSLLYREINGGPTQCHLFLRKGKLQFLNDCPHDLAGRTVDIPQWPDERVHIHAVDD
jgi:hypothetical protein